MGEQGFRPFRARIDGSRVGTNGRAPRCRRRKADAGDRRRVAAQALSETTTPNAYYSRHYLAPCQDPDLATSAGATRRPPACRHGVFSLASAHENEPAAVAPRPQFRTLSDTPTSTTVRFPSCSGGVDWAAPRLAQSVCVSDSFRTFPLFPHSDSIQ
jgi:hypothetical protein